MTVWIRSKQLEVGTLVRVDGDLDTQDVGELVAICGAAAGPVILDLAELRTLDSVGEACLRRLIEGGATVNAAAPYIRVRLGLAHENG
jgi:anti-anti-sigma regulatory factor